MNRRELLAAATAALFVLSRGAAAQSDPLAEAFAGLGTSARKAAQSELQTAGFYAGAIDGSYGAGTRKALEQAARFISDNSRGKARPQVGTTAGAKAFLVALSKGEMAKWLYGEGEEGEG